MTTQEIKEQFPKSYVKLALFGKQLLAQLVTAQLANSEEIKKEQIAAEDIPDEHIQPFLDGLLSGNSRSLYDMFDSNKVYIEINYEQGGFTYNIVNHKPTSELIYTNRPEAEKQAFNDGFSILEVIV